MNDFHENIISLDFCAGPILMTNFFLLYNLGKIEISSKNVYNIDCWDIMTHLWKCCKCPEAFRVHWTNDKSTAAGP